MHVLKHVERMERDGMLPAIVLNDWLSLNCPKYVLDRRSQTLIDEFKETMHAISADNTCTILNLLPQYVVKGGQFDEAAGKYPLYEQQVGKWMSLIVRMLRGPGEANRHINAKINDFKSLKKEGGGVAPEVLQRIQEARNFEIQLVKGLFDDVLAKGVNAPDIDLLVSGFILLRPQSISNMSDADLYRAYLKTQKLNYLADVVEGPPVSYTVQMEALRDGSIVFRHKFEEGRLFIRAKLNRASRRVHWKGLNKLFGYPNNPSRTARMKSLSELVWDVAGADRAGRFDYHRDHTNLALVNKVLSLVNINSWGSLVAGLLLYAMGTPSCIKLFDFLERQKSWKLTPTGFMDMLKLITTSTRRSSVLPDGTPVMMEEMCCDSYLNLMAGVAIGDIDVEKELANRLIERPPVVAVYDESFIAPIGKDHQAWVDHARRSLRDTWKSILPESFGQQSLKEFAMRRREKGTSGSDRSRKMLIDGRPVTNMTKKLALENYTVREICTWIYKKATEEGIICEKGNELGKNRALIPTPIDHYVLACFSLNGVEGAMHKKFGLNKGLKGLDPARLQDRIMRSCRMLEGHIMTCEDFADFNAQCAGSTESLLYMVQWEVAAEKNVHPDVLDAIKWHAKSHVNKYITVKGKRVRIYQGLFSGTFATDIGNTLHNITIEEVNYNSLVEVFPWLAELVWGSDLEKGLSKDYPHVDHCAQGDDVFNCTHRLLAPFAHQHKVNSDWILQPTKLKAGKEAEFLRTFITGSSITGFSSRSIASLNTRDPEAREISSVEARVSAKLRLLDVCSRRGVSDPAVRFLARSLIDQGRRVSFGRKDRAGVTVPLTALQGHPLDGGWGVVGPGQAYSVMPRGLDPWRSYLLNLRQVELTSDNAAIHDWVVAVSEELGSMAWDVPRTEMILEDELKQAAIDNKLGKDIIRQLKVVASTFLAAYDKVRGNAVAKCAAWMTLMPGRDRAVYVPPTSRQAGRLSDLLLKWSEVERCVDPTMPPFRSSYCIFSDTLLRLMVSSRTCELDGWSYNPWRHLNLDVPVRRIYPWMQRNQRRQAEMNGKARADELMALYALGGVVKWPQLLSPEEVEEFRVHLGTVELGAHEVSGGGYRIRGVSHAVSLIDMSTYGRRVVERRSSGAGVNDWLIEVASRLNIQQYCMGRPAMFRPLPCDLFLTLLPILTDDERVLRYVASFRRPGQAPEIEEAMMLATVVVAALADVRFTGLFRGNNFDHSLLLFQTQLRENLLCSKPVNITGLELMYDWLHVVQSVPGALGALRCTCAAQESSSLRGWEAELSEVYSGVLSAEWSGQRPPIHTSVMRMITSTPFKSLSQVAVAFHLSQRDAFIWCMKNSKVPGASTNGFYQGVLRADETGGGNLLGLLLDSGGYPCSGTGRFLTPTISKYLHQMAVTNYLQDRVEGAARCGVCSEANEALVRMHASVFITGFSARVLNTQRN